METISIVSTRGVNHTEEASVILEQFSFASECVVLCCGVVAVVVVVDGVVMLSHADGSARRSILCFSEITKPNTNVLLVLIYIC